MMSIDWCTCLQQCEVEWRSQFYMLYLFVMQQLQFFFQWKVINTKHSIFSPLFSALSLWLTHKWAMNCQQMTIVWFTADFECPNVCTCHNYSYFSIKWNKHCNKIWKRLISQQELFFFSFKNLQCERGDQTRHLRRKFLWNNVKCCSHTRTRSIVTSVTLFWRRLAGNTVCSPSERGPHHRSCRQCDHSWPSRSWWHHSQGNAAQLGSLHMPAPDASSRRASLTGS